MRVKIVGICLFAVGMFACDGGDVKREQTINFGEIAPQQLRDGYLQLHATASSGLPVSFASWDESIALIEGDKVRFLQAGSVNITAYQAGNDLFYEAPEIQQRLLIRDWDMNKKIQTIDFELPSEWKISRDGQQVKLKAVSSSGLPVAYTLESTQYGRLLQSSNTLYLYHAGEGGTQNDKAYDVQISVVASQGGNDEYNPADNVTQTMRVTGDVFH
ncbi:MAG: hypothetical protein LBG77_06080 [Dysgonamonadaceae bacterium]|jgi:hypothetical protein|nr:hypothetical protein [Dysgonamonadaceae bacterium]